MTNPRCLTASILMCLLGCAAAPEVFYPPPIVKPGALDPGRGLRIYRVEGAAGREQQDARSRAARVALLAAAREIGKSDAEKLGAERCVEARDAELRSLASPGEVYRNVFRGRDELAYQAIDIKVTVRKADLARQLEAWGCISRVGELVGRPTFMVVARNEDCQADGRTRSCLVSDRIATEARTLHQTRAKALSLRQQIAVTGCEGHDVGSGLVRSDETEIEDGNRTTNCGSLVSQLRGQEARIQTLQHDLTRLHTEQEALVDLESTTEVTVNKLNAYLVDQHFAVKDRAAVRAAQRLQQAITAARGSAADEVAARAQIAGADIYVQFGVSETTAGGGYQLELDAKAFDVVTGQLLAAHVGTSLRLAEADRGTAISQAATRVMPDLIDQVNAYWSRMARDVMPTRLVLRGSIGPRRADLVDLLDEVARRMPGCEDAARGCAFELGQATDATLEGTLRVPAKRRPEVGLAVETALREETFSVEIVVTRPALTILEVF